MQRYLAFSDEVIHARAAGRPIVALESTIISHGMPYPQNVQTAREVEQIIRDAGAVPATIAVIGGKIRIGLSGEELDMLGTSSDAMKASRRDLPYALSSGKLAATTVAATMICADMAGISVFVTGGIGGVHRGYPHPPDVSADLGELARTRALVVSAGIKSLLDVPATLEVLETLGVPVLGFRTETLPLFYAASGGPPVPARVDSPGEAAAVAHTHWELGGAGLVLAQPPPTSLDDIEPLIERALEDAERAGVRGQAVTPFVLSFLHEQSGGRTLAVNRELIVANAGLASQVAAREAGDRDRADGR